MTLCSPFARFLVLAFFALGLHASVEAKVGWKVGNTAPPLVAKDQNGKRFNLRSLKGKYVLIEFSAVWCDPCRYLAADLAGLKESLTAHGLPFEHVTVLLQDANNNPARLSDALGWATAYDLLGSPVLHPNASYGSVYSTMARHLAGYTKYALEGGELEGGLPTLVFLDPKQRIIQTTAGWLSGTEIQNVFKTGLPEVPEPNRDYFGVESASVTISYGDAVGTNSNAESFPFEDESADPWSFDSGNLPEGLGARLYLPFMPGFQNANIQLKRDDAQGQPVPLDRTVPITATVSNIVWSSLGEGQLIYPDVSVHVMDELNDRIGGQIILPLTRDGGQFTVGPFTLAELGIPEGTDAYRISIVLDWAQKTPRIMLSRLHDLISKDLDETKRKTRQLWQTRLSQALAALAPVAPRKAAAKEAEARKRIDQFVASVTAYEGPGLDELYRAHLLETAAEAKIRIGSAPEK